jgi:streptogramin lyase
MRAKVLLSLVGLVGCGSINPPSNSINWDETDSTIPATGQDDADTDRVPVDLPPILDVGEPGEYPDGQTCSGVAAESFSYIWISNSIEGTVSKIDTVSGAELARYYTGPSEGIDDPSRTSVGFSGDVVVANRLGSMVVIAADQDRCVDRNGNGTIDTSSGATDVLDWGEDECVRWHRPLDTDSDTSHGPRPVGWDTGPGLDPCEPDDDRIWIGWFMQHLNKGVFERRSGVDGELIDHVEVEDWDKTRNNDFGPYGGAIDGEGNFWVLGLFGPLVEIHSETLEVERWEVPAGTSPYGIALDEDGEPWLAGFNGNVLHLDPDTGWDEPLLVGEGRRMRGLQVDQDGLAWIAANEPCGLVMVDTKSKSVVYDDINLPDCIEPVGVSVDIEGNIWLPDFGANAAFKFNPNTFSALRTEGLHGPYTYSDMTGAGLRLVTHRPEG